MILSKANDAALRLTADAQPYLKAAVQGTNSFTEAAFGGGDAPLLADPHAVAAAVTAQVQALTPELAAAGGAWSDLKCFLPQPTS